MAQKNWYWENSLNKSEYPQDRKEKLENIGISFARHSDRIWDKNFNNLVEFRNENPDKWPKNNEEFPKGNNLGIWCTNLKQCFRKGTLEKFKQEILESVGFKWGRVVVKSKNL